MDDARSVAEGEALQFECERLRREMRRLVAANQTLEAQLALARSENEGLRQSITAMERSRGWRVLQRLRKLLGRQW